MSRPVTRGPVRASLFAFVVAFTVLLIAVAGSAFAQDTAPPDTAPPETVIEEGPKPMAGSANPAFKFSSPLPVGGIQFRCRIDAGPWESCSSPKKYTGLSDGPHRFEVQATDAAGVRDQIPAAHDWIIDATAPDVELGGSLRNAANAGDPLLGPTYGLKVAANDGPDPSSGVKSIEVLLGPAEEGAPPSDEVSSGQLDFEQLACPQGECSLSLDTIFKAEDIAGGEHNVKVLVKDELGHVGEKTLSVTIPEDPSTTAIPDTAPCTDRTEPTNFQTYSLGPIFEGLEATDVIRQCEQTYPGEPVRRNSVTYAYGEQVCTPAGVAPSEAESCSWPLQIQTWPACERTLADYKLIPKVPYPRVDFGEQRSVPVFGFDDLSRVELYTGTSTVVVLGADPAQAQRAIAAVRAEPLFDPPSMPAVTSGTPSSELPDPVPTAVTGELTCP